MSAKLDKTQSFVEEIENLRRLQSFCSKDLRSTMGLVHTSLALFAEEHPRPTNEIENLLLESLRSIKESLQILDKRIRETKSPLQVGWFLYDGKAPDFQFWHRGHLLLIPIHWDESLKLRLQDYSPSFVVIDTSLDPAIPWSDAVQLFRPTLTRVYLMGLTTEELDRLNQNLKQTPKVHRIETLSDLDDSLDELSRQAKTRRR